LTSLRSKGFAIGCVCLASAMFAMTSALVKFVSDDIPTVEVVLFRCAVAILVTWPVMWRSGASLRTKYPWGHALRTLMGLAGMFGSFYGYAHLPIVTVTAMNFVMPLVLTLLSALVLRERVTPPRIMAVVAGFLGVLVMLRPWQSGGDQLPTGPVLAVLSGVVGWAVAMLTIRRMGALGEASSTIVMWYTLGASFVAAVLSVPVWVTPHGWALVALIGIGLISGLAQIFMTEGYRLAESSLVAPFEYGAIFYSTALSVAIWGQWPDLWSLAGAVILIGSGMVVWRSR
jgi:drug/metabolite transporter (DMT)-like permease